MRLGQNESVVVKGEQFAEPAKEIYVDSLKMKTTFSACDAYAAEAFLVLREVRHR
jgi:hypothetical protein